MERVAAFLDRAVGMVAWGGLTLLALSMFVICIMLIRAPEVADRAISFDLAMVHVVGIIALSAIMLNQFMLLDTLIVVSVLGFLGTVAIARYLERGLYGSLRDKGQATSDKSARKRPMIDLLRIILVDLVVIFLMIVGVGFMLLSAFGLIRMPNTYGRLHASGKAGTLGIICILLASGVHVGTLEAILRTIALILLFFITAPIATHMIGRIVWRAGGHPRCD